MSIMIRPLILGLVLSLSAVNLSAAQVSVAVAANFSAPLQKIAQLFEQETGHKLIVSVGSTGGIYAQIKNGAPFQVFLSADHQTPLKLENEGHGVVGSRFTYATGKLALWSAQAGFVDDLGDVLKRNNFQKIAMANPKLAPYGAAAMQTLMKLGLWDTLKPKLVQGDNIAQTYQFVVTENAQLGFVAMSQIVSEGKIIKGSAWRVPAHWHSPLQQEAILLAAGKNNPTATAFLAYLKTDKAKSVIRSFGYDV